MIVWLVVAFLLELPVSVTSIDGRVVSATDPLEIISTSDEPILLFPFELGDRVEQGEVLLAFDPVALELELESSRQRAVKLEQELVSLARELANQSESLTNELDSYDRSVERLEARMGETRAEIEYAIDAEALYAQLKSERRIDALEYARTRAELEQSRMRLQAQEAELDELSANRRLAASRNASNRAKLTREQSRLEGELAMLKPEIRRLENRVSELTVRAPFDGEIGAILRASTGQTVPVEDWIMTLVPKQTFEFQAEFAAREAAGRLQRGQIARIQFDTLPWTEYGMLDATVLRVGSEERGGTVRVDFELASDEGFRGLLRHGLTGQVVVRIDEATLAQRLLRLLSERTLLTETASSGAGAS